MVHDSCASLFLDASTVSTVFPCQYNKTFYLEQHKLHFSKFYFLDFYKKKLKYIMQDLDGKRLNSAVNLGKMLWTGCCLFYDRVYEFLWAQKTFYCTPTPVLEPSMVRVCFFTRAALKNLKKNKKINQSQEQTLPQVPSLLPASSSWLRYKRLLQQLNN